MEEKTVELAQGIWCNFGNRYRLVPGHIIPKGEKYVRHPDGHLSCVEHRDEIPREVALAGSHQ